ncbi:MAG TPA: thiamine phosphate synthase [Candidatus Sulfotelmatobacter sp.]|nr:thiamine phosphate synthase [Candidatus Sulfotelmatobacter sp.]
MLYYITDRTAFPGDEPTRRRRLLEKIAEAARAGVDCIQLREKDLSPREMEQLARQAVQVVREAKKLACGNRQLATALLINSRTDIAMAIGADGVHLRSDDVSPAEVRAMWQCGAGTCGAGTLTRENSPRKLVVAVSCHSPQEVSEAGAQGATFAVFAPIFEKKDAPHTRSAGLIALREACLARIPVLALGGVTLENAQSCLDAGAAGIAAIRLFQENDVAEVVAKLRGLRGPTPSTSPRSSKPA